MKKIKKTEERVIWKNPKTGQIQGATVIEKGKTKMTIKLPSGSEKKVSAKQTRKVEDVKEMRERISERLRRLRKKNGYRLREVASCLGISITAYAKIERNETKEIGLQHLQTLANIYNTTVIKLLQQTEK